MKFAKKKYQKGIAESVQKSPNSFWSHGDEETKSKSSIVDLKDKNGEIKTDDKDKAENLNDFFASVFTVEGNSELPDFQQKVTDDKHIHTTDIKPEKVLKQLKNLNVANHVALIIVIHISSKRVPKRFIYVPLSEFFRKSISTGDVPKEWKKANITCIFKKGNKGNYRPVSLTSAICKLLESSIKEEVMNYLSRHHLLSDSQFGFRKNRSTILQLLTVMQEWTDALDNNLRVDIEYLDL